MWCEHVQNVHVYFTYMRMYMCVWVHVRMYVVCMCAQHKKNARATHAADLIDGLIRERLRLERITGHGGDA